MTRGTDLTRFQIDILSILYDRPYHGAGIQRELEEYYESDIPHRRVYENLDKLADMNLVEKKEFAVSDKTHEYRATEEGKIVVYEYTSQLALRMNII